MPKKKITPVFKRTMLVEIHAVGTSIASALRALGRGTGWGKVADIEIEVDPNNSPAQWFVRFTAGGTSMKASGEYVNGGVVVTWWK